MHKVSLSNEFTYVLIESFPLAISGSISESDSITTGAFELSAFKAFESADRVAFVSVDKAKGSAKLGFSLVPTAALALGSAALGVGVGAGAGAVTWGAGAAAVVVGAGAAGGVVAFAFVGAGAGAFTEGSALATFGDSEVFTFN